MGEEALPLQRSNSISLNVDSLIDQLLNVDRGKTRLEEPSLLPFEPRDGCLRMCTSSLYPQDNMFWPTLMYFTRTYPYRRRAAPSQGVSYAR